MPFSTLVRCCSCLCGRLPFKRFEIFQCYFSTLPSKKVKLGRTSYRHNARTSRIKGTIRSDSRIRPARMIIDRTKEMPLAVSDSGVSSFSSLFLREDVVASLENIDITKPTAIQALAIPKIAAGKNILCASETGSGKTLAYLAPIIHQLKEEETNSGLITRLKRPRACIIVPARELARQILKVAKSLCHVAKFRVIGIIGGKKQKIMQQLLEAPTDIVVATPGMLVKYFKYDYIHFTDLMHLVLDEADTLFDDSFQDKILEILARVKIREGKHASRTEVQMGTQVVIVGAAIPGTIERLLKSTIPNLKVVSSKNLHKLLPHVRQEIIKLRQEDKAKTLLKLLKEHDNEKVIVFCNTIHSCNWLGHYLSKFDIPLLRLHGGMPPEERIIRFDKYQSGEYNLLVATDVASRGLDTKHVGCIINFDFPVSASDYIHRSGRTGRVGGNYNSIVISFISRRKDLSLAKQLETAALKNKVVKDVIEQPKRRRDAVQSVIS